MKLKSQELIEQLIAETVSISGYAEHLKTFSAEQLNYRKSDNSWSMLECIEHLNLYGRFYIPEITKRLEEYAKNSFAKKQQNIYFRSGWLGNYFAKSMLPKDKPNKMKTFQSMNPIHSKLEVSVIDEFITQQSELLQLLRKAETADLTKIKTGVSISKWIRLRLGDTLRVVIYHNMRHIEQVRRIINYQVIIHD